MVYNRLDTAFAKTMVKREGEKDKEMKKMKSKAMLALAMAGLMAMPFAGCAREAAGADSAESAAAESVAAEGTMAGTAGATEAESAEETAVAFEYTESEGLSLPVPAEYADLVLVELPKEGENFLFRVSEKASVEAVKAMGRTETAGAGELFEIRKTTEEDARALVENDIPGETVFGKDGEGNYYVISRPTDVRIEREDMNLLMDPEGEEMKRWQELNRWASEEAGYFLEANASLVTADTLYTVADFCLPIPFGYEDLLVVDTYEEDEQGRLFRVSEKASLDAAKAKGYSDTDGIGELFAIRKMTREEFAAACIYDMSGQLLFATDRNGDCYLFCRPTDVRFEREDMSVMYDESSPERQSWDRVARWARTMPETIIAANRYLGLVEEDRTSQELDVYLTRMAFTDAVPFTISTTEFGPLEPEGVDPAPFLNRLRRGEYTSRIEAYDAVIPEGEYIVLDLVEEGRRFDFFLQEGSENFVREVIGGDVEVYYSMSFRDDTETASGIMQDWYDALAEAKGLK